MMDSLLYMDIVAALKPFGFEIYDDEMEQDVSLPCFYVFSSNVDVSRSLNGYRYVSVNYLIRYVSDERIYCSDLLSRVLFALEDVCSSWALNLSANYNDDGFSVVVSYRLTGRVESLSFDNMEVLKYEI